MPGFTALEIIFYYTDFVFRQVDGEIYVADTLMKFIEIAGYKTQREKLLVLNKLTMVLDRSLKLRILQGKRLVPYGGLGITQALLVYKWEQVAFSASGIQYTTSTLPIGVYYKVCVSVCSKVYFFPQGASQRGGIDKICIFVGL